MKKILMSLAIILAVIIMPKISEAADLPDFLQLGSGITFDRDSSDTSDVDADDLEFGCRTYFFNCAVGQEADLAARYANNLIGAGNFQLIKYYNETDGARNWFIVHLNYTGSKNVAKFYNTGASDGCNFDLHAAVNEGFVALTIATGLTYDNEQGYTPSTSTSTVNQPARSGADVPDFMTIGGGVIVYKTSQINSDGSTSIFYYCNLNDDLQQDFFGKYSALLNQYGFHFVHHDETKFNAKRLKENRKSETWTFQNNSYGQVSVKRVRDKSDGKSSFTVRIYNGLTYAGNYSTPKRNAGGGEGEMCWRCRGSGTCQECGGSGYVSVWAGDEYIRQMCNECRGNGTCRWCGGTGKS